MEVSLEKLAENMVNCKEICIVYHIRPDGDCIGSSYALALALKSLGIKVNVVGDDEVPHMQRYLTDIVPMDMLTSPAFCAVDSSSIKRTGSYGDKQFTFCIDHHENNSINAQYKYIETSAGACAEIVFKLIEFLKVKVTKEIADLLYTGLVCDTMCFRSADTCIQSFETAMKLASSGADVFSIGRHNMFYKTKERLHIEEILKRSFRFIENGKIGTGIITLSDLKKANIQDSELEGINSLIEEVEDVIIGTTIRELPDGRSRCSMRTKGGILANEICSIHGGGGHRHAACCELDLPPLKARRIIESTCAKIIRTNS